MNFKKLLATALLTLSLAIHAGLSIPPDGKMTLYYEDGSKKIEKEYKHGQPIGIWKRWYDNGEVWGVITFANTALPNYDYSSQIVKIELRYSDKDNTIRYKGEQFAKHLINTKNDDGGSLVMPMWDYIENSYDKDGKPIKDNFVAEIRDDLTGKTYHFPSLYWQGVEDVNGNKI